MAKARILHPLSLVIGYFLAIALPGFVAASAKGAGFEELHRFSRLGFGLGDLVHGPNGYLYGITGSGGLSNAGTGTLFSVDPASGAVKTLAYFGLPSGIGGLAGDGPYGRIAADAFNVYGLSDSGKTIWRWNLAHGLTRIAVLTELGLGGDTRGVTSDKSGGLVGTSNGSPGGAGFLWRWHPSTGAQRLGSFTEETTGLTTPGNLAMDSQGGIYGCSAPLNDRRILWRWKTGSGFEKLAELPTITYGTFGLGLSIDANNHVWGVTWNGGAHEDGVLWRWTPQGGVMKLGDLNSPETNAPASSPVIFAADSTPYFKSGSAIWKWTAADGLVIHGNLPWVDVGLVRYALALDDTGAFFGTSHPGGNGGQLWKWTAAGGAESVQVFPSGDEPPIMDQGVARDAQGRIYGSTRAPFKPTILWRWSAGSGYELLASFDPTIYGRGSTLPAVDAAGNVYGIMEAQPLVNNAGKLWRWNEADGLVKLADFNPADHGSALPVVVFGSNGAIYGTSESANFSVQASWVWKWTAGGGIVKVGSFDYLGSSFSPGPITGPSGEWFGTQPAGGAFPNGRLWSYSETGGLGFRHNFDDFGAGPNPVLARDSAGTIYGTRGRSEAVLWKWRPTSGYSTLAFFEEETGTEPVGLRVDPSSGVVRGVCQRYGAYSAGTIWSWSEASGLHAVHHFDPQSAGVPGTLGLVEDDDGNLFGLVQGLLWRYTAGPLPLEPGAALRLQGSNENATSFIGTISPNGLLSSASLRWGESPDNLSNAEPPVPIPPTGVRAVDFNLRDLPQRRLLFAAIVAKNSQGSSMSNIISFVTPNRRPEAGTDFLHSPPLDQPYFTFDVLTNDSDPADPLTLVSVEQGEHGLAEIVDNKIRYTPGPSYQGEDDISYTISDGRGGTSSASLILYNGWVTAQNDVVARGQGNLTIHPLANDSDEDGDALRIVSVTQPRQSTVTFSGTSIIYQPAENIFGSERFTYTVTDDRGRFATASVEVRATTLEYRTIAAVGTAVEISPDEILLVTGLGSPGTSLGGLLRIHENFGPRPNWMLLNPDNFHPLLRRDDELPGMPGTSITSIDEPAGRAVLVKFSSDGAPKKLRNALLFLDSQNQPVVVAHDGAVLSDDSRIVSIDRYSEANGRVFLLAKIRLLNGKTVQSLRVWQDGHTQELIRQGTTELRDSAVKSIKTLVPIAGSPAVNRWVDDNGRIAAQLTFANGHKALVVFQAGQDPRIVQETPLGFDGDKIHQLGPPVLGPTRTAFRQVSSYFPGTRTTSLCQTDPDIDLDEFVRVGGYATEEPWTTFAALGDPVAGADDSYAFTCSVRYDPNDFENPGKAPWKALCWYRGFDRYLVASPTGLLPGSEKERFGPIKSIAMSPQSTRGPVFTTMTGKKLSLWATSDSGTPILVVKPGQSLTINGTPRKVVSVRALEGTTGRGIANRAFDGTGRVQAILKFEGEPFPSLVEFALP